MSTADNRTNNHAPVESELGDLSNMPRDPRWRLGAFGELCHRNRPGGVGIVIPTGPDQEHKRRLTDWYHAYHAAAAGVARLEKQIKEQGRPRKRPHTPKAKKPQPRLTSEELESIALRATRGPVRYDASEVTEHYQQLRRDVLRLCEELTQPRQEWIV